MDRLSTATPTLGTTEGRPTDVRVASSAPTLVRDRGASGEQESSASEPPVRYPMDDEERNIIDLLEHDLVLEE